MRPINADNWHTTNPWWESAHQLFCQITNFVCELKIFIVQLDYFPSMKFTSSTERYFTELLWFWNSSFSWWMNRFVCSFNLLWFSTHPSNRNCTSRYTPKWLPSWFMNDSNFNLVENSKVYVGNITDCTARCRSRIFAKWYGKGSSALIYCLNLKCRGKSKSAE